MTSRKQSFPVFNLPDVALQIVVSQIDVTAFLKLHLNSTKIGARQLVEKCPSKAWNVNVTVTSTFQSVEIIGTNKFSWECYWPRHQEAANYRSQQLHDVVLDGYPVRVSIHQNRMVTVSERFEDDLLHWTQFLKDLFQCKTGTIRLHPRHTSDFDKIFTSPVLFDSEHLIIGKFLLEAHEAKFLLEHNNTEHFECKASTRRDFRHTKPIVFPIVELSNGAFLTLDNLVQMSNDCEQVKIEKTELTSEQLNEWLQKWMRSESKKLKSLELNFRKENAPDSEQVLEGINKIAVKERKRQDESRSAWTIQRSDGVQATIVFFSSEEWNSFQFNVTAP